LVIIIELIFDQLVSLNEKLPFKEFAKFIVVLAKTATGKSSIVLTAMVTGIIWLTLAAAKVVTLK